MAIIVGQEFREQWYAQNVSSRILSLGDLPNMPSFNPGDAYDLLLHHNKTDISKSLNLKEAILLGWIEVTKVVDSASETYSGGEAVDSVTSAEVSDLEEESGGSSDGTVKVSSNDTTAGYLNGKLVAGSNVTLTEGSDGGNETLTIAASSGGNSDLASHTTTSSSYTAGTNSETVIYADASSNAITINLPAAASSSDKVFYIKKIDSSVNAVTVDGNSSETIDGDTTKVINGQYLAITIHCDGSNWFII